MLKCTWREEDETAAQGVSDRWTNSLLNKTTTKRLLPLREQITYLGWDGDRLVGEIVTLIDNEWKKPQNCPSPWISKI